MVPSLSLKRTRYRGALSNARSSQTPPLNLFQEPTRMSPWGRTGRVICAALRFRLLCGFDESDAADAQIRTWEFRVVERNGEKVRAGGESAGDAKAVNDAIIIGTLRNRRREEIG